MAQPKLKLPADTNSEIYFDPNRLVVDFRQKKAKEKATGIKVLRVVVQCYGFVIEDRFFEAGSEITAGESKKNIFRLPLREIGDRHTLIEYKSDRTIELSINKFFNGVIQTDGRLKTVSDLIGTAKGNQTITLPSGSKGCLEQGTLLIYFEEIPDPEKVPPVAIFKNLSDPYFKRWFIVSLVLHLLILLLLKILGPYLSQEQTLEQLEPEFRKIIVQEVPVKAYTPPRALSASNLSRGPQGREGEGERAAGEEGRRGKGVPGAGGRVTNKDIKRTGVLDVFSKSGKGSALSKLLGGAGIPSEFDKNVGRAARYGLPGESVLREGKGLKGGGAGGGGRTESIGSGLGTKGKGGGRQGTGYADFGTGKSDTAVSASIDSEEVYVMGNLPRDVIAKIMEDNMGAIRFCYSKQIQIQPDLRGKVTVNFVIGLEGNVTSTGIKKSTLGSQPVEQCILNVIRRIQFPKPGGGIVEVNSFPFSFHVAG